MQPSTRAPRSFLQVAVLSGTLCGTMLFAQEPPSTPAAQPSPNPAQASSAQAPAPTEPDCIEPEPMLSAEDYDGPFKKIAAHVSRKLERKTAHRPHHRPGAVLCSLTTGEKFRLFQEGTTEPLPFVVAGFTAGLA